MVMAEPRSGNHEIGLQIFFVFLLKWQSGEQEADVKPSEGFVERMIERFFPVRVISKRSYTIPPPLSPFHDFNYFTF
jgi:hypothetical protein